MKPKMKGVKKMKEGSKCREDKRRTASRNAAW